jgi:hypothetical protein
MFKFSVQEARNKTAIPDKFLEKVARVFLRAVTDPMSCSRLAA